MLKRMLKIIGIILLAVVIIGGVFAFRIWRANRPVSLRTSEDAIVGTTAGNLRGAVNDGIYSYRGVPYAEARELFVPADSVTPWDGVRDAIEYGEVSRQGSLLGMSGDSDEGSNNCQNLNLWTPALGDGRKRPVMVWLHGGGFSTGSANEVQYDGTNLAKNKDVVVVGVNHRLNITGFLDLSAYGEKYRYSGNIGVDDIRLSLMWIRDNIEAFGGDPANVTVFGQSGGGAKVIALMNSPYATDLFARGIVESGATPTMGETFATKEIGARTAELVLEKLGITGDNIEDIQNVSFEKLSKAGDEALSQVAQEYQIPAPLDDGYSFEWGPVVDGDYEPVQPIEEGAFATAGDKELLIGSNLNEWTTMSGENSYADEDSVREQFAVSYPNEPEDEYAKVDTLIRPSLKKLAAAKASAGSAKVYAYVMTFESGNFGSYHGAEIPFVFQNAGAFGGTPDRGMTEMMSSLWSSFAGNGVPEADGVPQWEAFTEENGSTMILDNKCYLAGHHDDLLLELIMGGE